MVKTKEFTHRGILEAIKDGSFYASSGPLFHDFYVEEGVAHVTCEPCQDIYFRRLIRRSPVSDEETG